MAANAEATQKSPTKRKVHAFGRDDCLLGSINGARDDSAIGAVLWGLGIAEVKTARRLGKQGIPSLQVRINNVEFSDKVRRDETYARHGIEYCVAAMDYLGTARGAERFILMGNCACASFCLNAAIEDERVVGLILTNPHISKRQLLRVSLWHKLAVPGTWKRLFSGGINLQSNLLTIWKIVASRVRRHKAESGATSRSTPEHRRSDYELPDNLVEELEVLDRRGVKVLFVCASTDDSLHYLRARYGSGLDRLQVDGDLTFECVEASTHVFSKDDDAARLLNEAISRWIESTRLTP